MQTSSRIAMMALVGALSGSFTTGIVSAAAAQTTPATATRKGVVKKIDDTTLVMTPADDKKLEVTYALTAATKRNGQIAAGGEVVVSYHYEQGKVVVSAVSAKASK
jgi:hypothetical protein